MAPEVLPDDPVLDSSTLRIDRDLVRSTVFARLDAVQAVLKTEFPTVDAQAAIRRVRRRAERHGGDPKPGMTLRELTHVQAAFFAFETVHDLCPVVPELAARRSSAIARARTSVGSLAAWGEAHADFIVDGRVPMIADDAGLGEVDQRSHRGNYLKWWRHFSEYGVARALYGHHMENFGRLHPAVAVLDLDDPRGEAITGAYFAHLERETERASYPLGLVSPRRRDQVVLAIALCLEAESGGTFARALGAGTDLARGATATNLVLRAAFAAAERALTASPFALVRSPGRFDLVRAGAGVHAYFEPMAERSPSGWVTAIEQRMFDIPVVSGIEHAFALALRRLLPHSVRLAAYLDRLRPAGSIDAVAKAIEDWSLPKRQGEQRADAIVAGAREHALEGYYRQRVERDQVENQEKRATVRAVQPAVLSLMRKRVFTVLVHLGRVRDEPVDETDLPPALEPEQAANVDWLDDFIGTFEQDLNAWKTYLVTNRHVFSRNEVHGFKAATLFAIWLRSTVEEWARLVESSRIERRRGAALSSFLEQHPVSAFVEQGLRSAIDFWAQNTPDAETPRAQDDARRDVWRVAREMYGSSWWRQSRRHHDENS